MENYTNESKNYYFYTFHFDLFICFFALFFPLSFIFLNPFKGSFFFYKTKYCVSSTNTGCLAMCFINQNAGLVRASCPTDFSCTFPRATIRKDN